MPGKWMPKISALIRPLTYPVKFHLSKYGPYFPTAIAHHTANFELFFLWVYFVFIISPNLLPSLCVLVEQTLDICSTWRKPTLKLEQWEGRACNANPLLKNSKDRRLCSWMHNKVYCVCIMYQTAPIFTLIQAPPFFLISPHFCYIYYYYKFPLRRSPLLPIEVFDGPPTGAFVVAFPFAGKPAAYFNCNWNDVNEGFDFLFASCCGAIGVLVPGECFFNDDLTLCQLDSVHFGSRLWVVFSFEPSVVKWWWCAADALFSPDRCIMYEDVFVLAFTLSRCE